MIPTLVAHRGYMECYPENTLLSMQKAIDAGACVLEFDVHMTSEGEIIVLHDPDFLRTAGVDKIVHDLSLKEVQEVSVHQPGVFGDKFEGTYPSRLDDFLELLARYPQLTFFIEVKRTTLEHHGVEKVIDVILNKIEPYANQCVLISFNSPAIEYAISKNICKTGWILRKYGSDYHERAQELKPDLLMCNYLKVYGRDKLWPGNWQWMLYDITNPGLALHWAGRGAHYIETRDIGVMLKNSSLQTKACNHKPSP